MLWLTFSKVHANSLTQNNGVFFRSHSQDPSLFIQDNWRILPRLSINLGLRWEYYPMYTGQNNTGTFVPNTQSTRFPTAPLGLVFAGDKGIPDGILHTPWNTFAPRFGFAYDVFGTGKTCFADRTESFIPLSIKCPYPTILCSQPFSRSITVAKTPNLVRLAHLSQIHSLSDAADTVFFRANLFGMPNNKYELSVHEYSLRVQQQYGSVGSEVGMRSGPALLHHYRSGILRSTIRTAQVQHAHCCSTMPSTVSANTGKIYVASISIAAP